ncbi:MAG: gliding motility protein GldN [Bacteroidetes bacterium]|jgi:gliding motility associated protien GldN|nr:gliding motility protein GldN [Bacteroidota bacterium]
MKNLLGISMFLTLSISVWSQVPQEVDVITESTTDFERDQMSEDKYMDGVVERTLYLDAGVIPYEPVREADVPWEKRMWRIIDLREKINAPFTYPGKTLIEIFTDAAANGELTVFRKDDFQEPLPLDELEKQLYRIDTTRVTDPETLEETIRVTRSDFNPNDVKRYRIKEIWFFDKEVSRMRNRILGISPIRDIYDDDTGLFKREQPMFWVYFPVAREYLSKFQVFNGENDAAPLSWADYFDIRRFSSYIYKQTNVRGCRLKDEYPDDRLEQLYESERIKADLFNFEHDFWSY